jgi:shikimate dehydrogenase
LPPLAYKQRVSAPFAEPINASTRFCAVYGHPVKHSASPAMQNAGIAALGLNWRYLAFEVRPDNLRPALDGARAMRFVGVNLTVPHKLLAMEMVDVLDASAQLWGAVNTVRFEGKDRRGQWRPLHGMIDEPEEMRSHGFNTDADAISRAIREELQLDLAGAKVLLLGAGGAGRTAALKLATENVSELFLVNRTQSKADDLAREISQRSPQVKVVAGYPSADVDLMLNATSLGLKPADGLPYDENHFAIRKARAIYDMVYRPVETALLKAGKAAGCRTANGLGMLLHQGAKALELWTGLTAPAQVMRQALEQNVYGRNLAAVQT